jgi:hypothetical protein
MWAVVTSAIGLWTLASLLFAPQLIKPAKIDSSENDYTEVRSEDGSQSLDNENKGEKGATPDGQSGEVAEKPEGSQRSDDKPATPQQDES